MFGPYCAQRPVRGSDAFEWGINMFLSWGLVLGFTAYSRGPNGSALIALSGLMLSLRGSVHALKGR